jgi:hypothetical protein
MKPLVLCLVLFAGAAAADSGSFSRALRAEPHPSLYSFADVYRFTVAGPAAQPRPGDAPALAPLRVATAAARPETEPRFQVRSVPQPDKWMLVLAGLALAGWVAHRRLSHS